MDLRRLLLLLTILFLPLAANAQFYLSGDDPARAKWMSMDTDNYRIIYPMGFDSLARNYGYNLERYRIAVGRSAGYTPGGQIRGRMPVVLHPYTSRSNGSVAWAPKRMDLYTNPEPYAPEAMPWVKMLSIHESRHAAQMQFGLTKVFKPFGWFFGEMINGLSCLYPGTAWLEGDAVLAETALSSAGRGRSADFLNYYMAAFDNGDFRNWHKWRYGSVKHYYPNHYALGYLYHSGFRYVYDTPSLMGPFLEYCARRPYDILCYDSISKKLSGKNFKHSFEDVCLFYNELWQDEMKQRGPFTEAEIISDSSRVWTEYKGSVMVGKDIYSVKYSYNSGSTLVRIDSTGREKSLGAFASSGSKLNHSQREGRIYWSEYIRNPRWSLAGRSSIRYMDLADRSRHTLVSKGKFYNPAPSELSDTLAAVQQFDNARSAIVLIDTRYGAVTTTYMMPDSLQAIEPLFIGKRLYFSGLSEKGYGLYELVNGRPVVHLAPQAVKIVKLKAMDDCVLFESDLNGVNELYCYETDGCLSRFTNNRYGGSDWMLDDKLNLYFTENGHRGNYLKKLSFPYWANFLADADFSKPHVYPVAEKLAEQEASLALAEGGEKSVPDSVNVNFSAPKRYRKTAHLLNIHSWAPVYFNVDNIKSMSYEYIYDMVSPGLAFVSQNKLGTMVLNAGYAAHPDYNGSNYPWKHSGHIKMTYTGWYPVIEASLDVNDRNAYDYSLLMGSVAGKARYISAVPKISERPSIKGKLSVYIPLSFSRGGWNSGFIPQLSYSLSNDAYSGRIVVNDVQETVDESGNIVGRHNEFLGVIDGKWQAAHTVQASVRAYVMRHTAVAGVYPRLGIGAEAGVAVMPGRELYFDQNAYVHVYGYMPGITRQQGLKLSYTLQQKICDDGFFSSSVVNTLPRGVKAPSAMSFLGRYGSSSHRITADYAIPVYMGDLTMGKGMIYIKRMVLTPHFDCSFTSLGTMFSAGGCIQLDLGSFFWVPYPMSLGVSCSYNGGAGLQNLRKVSDLDIKNYGISPVFSISF